MKNQFVAGKWEWIHLGHVKSLVGKQHGNDRPHWRWLKDLVRSSLIQCQWKGETVSSSGLGQLLKEVTPDLVYTSLAPPSPVSHWLGPLCGGNTQGSCWIRSACWYDNSLHCVYHHRQQSGVNFTGFVMHMAVSHHRTFLSTQLPISCSHRDLK